MTGWRHPHEATRLPVHSNTTQKPVAGTAFMRRLHRLSVPGCRSILVFGRPARTQYYYPYPAASR
ncbi:hypothetical protein NXC14_CH00358 [Rhizobium sp. NXC14]|nr:hypothetical protein NXC14_CH00358 [Rhizobium sp. NXC14]